MNSIQKTLKQNAQNNKKLKERYNLVMGRLYDYMKRYNLKVISDYTIDDVKPKEKPKLKTIKQKREDGITLLRQAGVSNPAEMWEQLNNRKIPCEKV